MCLESALRGEGAVVSPASTPDGSPLPNEQALRAAGMGVFDWDLRTGALVWDESLMDLFGYDESTFGRTIESFTARLHSDDRAGVAGRIDRAIATCGQYAAEYRVVRPDESIRWVTARGMALPGPDRRAGRLIGAAFDSTLHRGEELRLARMLESMPTAYFAVDREWRFTYVNAEAERVLASNRDTLLGGVIWELFPFAVGSDFERHYRGAMESGEPVSFEAYYPPPLDAWYEVRAWPNPDGLSVFFLDVTQRRLAQDRDRDARRRAELAARASTELVETLDAERAVGALARIVVPSLADWCVVSLVEEHQSRREPAMRDVGAWHDDPLVRPLVQEYGRLRMQSIAEHSYLARAVRTGEPVLLTTDTTAAIQAVLGSAEARELLGRLAPGSQAILPVRGRGRTLGALTMFRDEGREPLDDDDLVLARDLAARAGLALDNARLYRQQQQMAEGLQRALLTVPPAVPGAQVAVRYVPAAEAARVGGDWYDVFAQPDGTTCVVIGDVVGHDIVAAAAMGQVRSLLRGIAVATGAGPADVLTQVDRALRTLRSEAMGTVLTARLEPTADDRAAGRTRVRWSSAGHPPAMVVHADGTVHVLSGAGHDPMLGILPDLPRHEAQVVLPPGATLVLYTDGLIERRDQSLREGLPVLRDALAGLAGLAPEDLCDALLARLLPPQPADDVAVVAVRWAPEPPL